MKRVPPDAPTRPLDERLTWRSILVSYAMMAAVPLLLWVAGRPLLRVTAVAAVVGAFAVARRGAALRRCFYECGGFAFDLGGSVRVTISRPRADDPA
jgi:hypothetical protein